MDLSVIIVNWNGLAVLKNCLDSIFSNSTGFQYEVIVVDNSSQDESIAVLERDFPQVIIIKNQDNRGFAAANNQGFAKARGRYVLLLNNDTLVLPDAFRKSVQYLDANPKVGALGCRIEFPDRSFQTSCYRFNNLLELFMVRLLPLGSIRNERYNISRYWGKQFTEPTEVDVVAGCFMMVRKEIVDTIGGLDEDFFMYGEDQEWCSRIIRAGWKIIYFPQTTIIHIHRFSSSKARRALRVIESMSPVLVLHKRRGHLVAWFANLILLLALCVRLPYWLVQDLIHGASGNAVKGLVRSRFVTLTAHLKGLFWPVWWPANKN